MGPRAVVGVGASQVLQESSSQRYRASPRGHLGKTRGNLIIAFRGAPL